MDKLSRREFGQTAIGAGITLTFEDSAHAFLERPLDIPDSETDPALPDSFEHSATRIAGHLRALADKIEGGEIDPASVRLSRTALLDRDEEKTTQSGCVYWDVSPHRVELLTYTVRKRSTNGA